MRVSKFILIMLAVWATNTSSFSQTLSDSSRFEIGIGIPHFPGTFSNWTPFPVISFKAIHNKNALRVGLFYDLTAPRPLNDYSYLLLNAGYERKFFQKKSKLLIGIDFCFLHRYINHKPDLEKTYFYHIGIGPIFGYQYRFSKNFSFQTEFGFFIGYGENKFDYNGIISKGDKGGYSTSHRTFSLNLFYHFN